MANQHAIIHGSESLEIYHLFQALDTVPDPANTSKALAGYLVDGFGANTGLDKVTFDLAESGQTIHAGAGYNGLVSYQGIYDFTGSAFDDVFTRYGSLVQDKGGVKYVGGGGRDVFDLRTGNNDVILSNGVVNLKSNDKPNDAPTDSDAALYANHFTADNTNFIRLLVPTADSQRFDVYGNTESFDVVLATATQQNQGVFLKYRTGDFSLGADYLEGQYALSRASDNREFGFFDNNVDAFYGTQFADTIRLDSGSKLKALYGGGGADSIEANVAGINIFSGGEGSLVLLNGNATDAMVYAKTGDGVRVKEASGVTVNVEDNGVYMGDERFMDTSVDPQGAVSYVATSVDLQEANNAVVNAGAGSRIAVNQATGQNATVNIDWLGADVDFNGALLYRPDSDYPDVTTVTANSAGTLTVNANDGFAKLQIGGLAGDKAKVNVGAKMDSLSITDIANQANALFLDLYFDSASGYDSSISFRNADGHTFTGAWRHGDTSTQLSLTVVDPTKVNLHFGSAPAVTLASVSS